MLASIAPSPPLLPFVDGYLHVRDLLGRHRGRPIRTAPRPGGVLTVNLGQPNRTAAGVATPSLSLLGIQSCARSWRSEVNTHFAMALLTPLGLARLVPCSGADTADALLDLPSLIGVHAVRGLADAVHARAHEPVAALDVWLLGQLCGEREKAEPSALRAACMVLSRATRVDAAAAELGMSRRHLSRIVSRHLGVGPKALIDLYRLDRSIRALQRGLPDSADGFADQAHQVREWRRRLGMTPGSYARQGSSALAESFGASADRLAFYL